MGTSESELKPLPDSRKLEIVHSAIKLIESRIQKQEISSSMADLIRLLELEAELSGRGAVRKIQVGWVPRANTTDDPAGHNL